MSEPIDSTGTGEGLTELRRSLGGAVLAPTDAGFDAARRCFNTLIDRRPAVIVRCLDAGDVARAFDFARAHTLEVAVRGGGHNPAGHCVCEGGLVIDLSLMRGVDVNGEARTARADGGARWLDFDTATQRFGLVTPGGVVGSTGVAGLTWVEESGISPLSTASPATISSAPRSLLPTARWSAQTRMRIPSCCGASAAAGATSVWRRDWSSGCTRCAESLAVASPTPEQESATGFADSGTSPPTHRGP
jgi:hypothetical protein